MIKKCVLCGLLLAQFAVPAFGKTSVKVLQQKGWWWTVPQQPQIEIVVNNDSVGKAICNVELDVTTDCKQPVVRMAQQVEVAAGDSVLTSFSLNLAPGFYRCKVNVDGMLKQEFNIGFEPENIVSLPDCQSDFAEFWDAARAELNTVSPEYELNEQLDKSDKNGRVYLVKMRSLGNEIIQGYLTVPAKCSKKNRMPVIVHYMGYGSKPWYAHPYEGAEFIEFVLSSRGQGLNVPTNKYGDWVVSGLHSKDEYYYRGAYMDLVRALDFVGTLPEADTRNIFAEGGSQGGAFTLAACALDRRIRAAAPWIPFLSDFPDYFKIVHWPAEPVLRKQKELGISDADLYATLSYFDIKNLARWIECPILMGVGLQDPVCPPHTNFSGYNLISSQKRFIIYTNCGHDTEHPSWDNEQRRFFKEMMIK
ncbi:MAG: acetylxylan esterase [Muribaculaceae bacterium]